MKVWIYCFLCADDFGIHFEIDTAGFTYTKKRKEACYHCLNGNRLPVKVSIGASDDKN
jgi:hypothetical protein